jgi:adenine/guanine phosphoribosyltransferase-like PRPP-binding protein
MDIRTSHLRSVYESGLFEKTVGKAIETADILLQKYQFDTIAFTGMSGAAMAYILAYKLGLQLLCVRKKTDGSHFHRSYQFRDTGLVCEGNLGSKRYLIVDDFISTGNTIKYIVESVYTEAPFAKCVAMLMYAQSMGRSFQHASWNDPIEVTSFLIEDGSNIW